MDKKTYMIYGISGGLVGLFLVFAIVSNFHIYLTDSPEMCASCHTMQSEYESQQHSLHRSLKCTDCHLPHDNSVKYWAYKGRDGLWDAYVYYTRQEPQVIELKQRSRQVVQSNCKRCHDRSIIYIEAMGSDRWCGDCHRQEIHPGPLGISSITPVKEGGQHDKQ